MKPAPLSFDDRKALVDLLVRRGGLLSALGRQNFLDDAGLYELAASLHMDEATEAFAWELVRAVEDRGVVQATGSTALAMLLRTLRHRARGHALERDLVDRLVADEPPPAKLGAAGEVAAPELRPFTVLFLAANPVVRDAEPLRLGAEARTISERLRESPRGKAVQLQQLHATRYKDLSLTMLEHRPQMLHFSGHGERGGELVFEVEDGRPLAMGTDVVAELFGILSGDLRLVLLNACWSEAQAQAIGRHVDFVVGMNRPVPDAAALRFAAGFYRGLGFGRSVQTCFDLARNEMASGSADPERMAAIPQLLVRPGADADAVLLAAG
ncbi:MAG: CHAT domain-containing protein [Ardenticatenia bacterium]|nr:CHAT domain-containing protein [Ardenticatenia bacterium]